VSEDRRLLGLKILKNKDPRSSCHCHFTNRVRFVWRDTSFIFFIKQGKFLICFLHFVKRA
jgi:hypothetical protein